MRNIISYLNEFQDHEYNPNKTYTSLSFAISWLEVKTHAKLLDPSPPHFPTYAFVLPAH